MMDTQNLGMRDKGNSLKTLVKPTPSVDGEVMDNSGQTLARPVSSVDPRIPLTARQRLSRHGIVEEGPWA